MTFTSTCATQGARPDSSPRQESLVPWNWRLWRPLPVALATILISSSLALFVLRNEPTMEPELHPDQKEGCGACRNRGGGIASAGLAG